MGLVINRCQAVVKENNDYLYTMKFINRQLNQLKYLILYFILAINNTLIAKLGQGQAWSLSFSFRWVKALILISPDPPTPRESTET